MIVVKTAAKILVISACWIVTFFGAGNVIFADVFNPDRFVLENGLEIIVVSDKRAPVVTHMLWYKVGSADDPLGQSGLAHFLEHLMFKGTKKYAPGKASKIIARRGGTENAFTSHDYTAFFQTIAPKHLAIVMDIEADRMVNLKLEEDTILAERDVVLEERRSRTENNDAALFREQVAGAMFLAHPYRIPIIGWQHEIKKLTGEMAIDFYRRWYIPNNAVLIVAGNISPKKVKVLAEQYYGPILRGRNIVRERILEPPQLAARRMTMESPQIGQAQWTRRYLAPSYGHGQIQHVYALQILSDILGNGTSSRLYKSLVVGKQKAVSVGSWYGADKFGPTTFGVYASPKEDVSIGELEKAIDNELNDILNKGVTEPELTFSKTRLKRAAVFARDSVIAPARIIGNAILSGRTIEEMEAWPNRIDEVTQQEVRAAASHVLVLGRSVTGILSPKHQRQILNRRK